jgi:hypothetical protein
VSRPKELKALPLINFLETVIFCSYSTVPFIITSEIFPLHIRGEIDSVAC